MPEPFLAPISRAISCAQPDEPCCVTRPRPHAEGGGSIDNTAWYNALFTQLTPGDLTAIKSQTAQITMVLQCPSGSAVAAQLANASITNDQLGQVRSRGFTSVPAPDEPLMELDQRYRGCLCQT